MRIDFNVLQRQSFPIGTNLAIYDRRGKKAFFYHKEETGFFSRRHVWAKREGSPIHIRSTDITCRLNEDGTVTPMALPEIFSIQ